MPEFLVETYAARDASNIITVGAGDIAAAADQVSEQGAQVRLLHAIFVPEDETCFYLFESSSAGAVREAMTHARLRPERITRAVLVRPPEAGPAGPPSAPIASPGPARNHLITEESHAAGPPEIPARACPQAGPGRHRGHGAANPRPAPEGRNRS